jgi:hypothetical protein
MSSPFTGPHECQYEVKEEDEHSRRDKGSKTDSVIVFIGMFPEHDYIEYVSTCHNSPRLAMDLTHGYTHLCVNINCCFFLTSPLKNIKTLYGNYSHELMTRVNKW